MAAVSASVAITPQVYTTIENSVEIETRYKKASTNKIIFNANGGKVGSKTKVTANIKKGSKISNLPSKPKRTGYKFTGWYTKKSGGKKISVNTKPTKSITYYAQWKKTTSSTASKIVGHWEGSKRDTSIYTTGFVTIYCDYYLYNDGRFQYYEKHPFYAKKIEGKYSVSNGKAHFKERKFYEVSTSGTRPSLVDVTKLNYNSIGSRGDLISTYTLGSDKDGVYLRISNNDNYFLDGKTLEQGKAYEYTYRKK